MFKGAYMMHSMDLPHSFLFGKQILYRAKLQSKYLLLKAFSKMKITQSVELYYLLFEYEHRAPVSQIQLFYHRTSCYIVYCLQYTHTYMYLLLTTHAVPVQILFSSFLPQVFVSCRQILFSGPKKS